MAKSRPTKKKSKPVEELPQLDPILPLAAGFNLPKLKQGQGKEILHNTKSVIVELPYNAAYLLWEHAEAKAESEYPKYVTGPLSHIAEARLATVRALRSTFNNEGDPIPVYTEEEAQRIRSKRARREKKAAAAEAEAKKLARAAKKGTPISETSTSAECAHEHTVRKKSKKTGEKYVLCTVCGSKWPSASPGKAPQSPPKGSKPSRGTLKASKAAKKPSKGKKTAKR